MATYRQWQVPSDVRFLATFPQILIAPVARIMKAALPENSKIAKESKECMQECVSEFISFIISEGKLPRPPSLYFKHSD
jgi:hypothetical protein